MTIELTYDGETFTYPNLCLTELPFGFEESDVKRGRTAEVLNLSGLLKREDAEAILVIYRNWRNDKIEEQDPQKTGVIGATVGVSGDGIGFEWIDRPCWFSKAPEITYAGIYARVSIGLVDAEQSLEVLVEEEEDSEEEGVDFGTFSLGGATINLTAYPNVYEGLPELSRNPAGAHVISGSLTLEEIKEIEGWVSSTDLSLLVSWLNTTIATTPAANSYFPTSWDRPSAKNRTIEGVVTLTYDIQIRLVKIKG